MSKIPRLDGVLDVLEKSQNGAGSETDEDATPAGARVLRIAVDYAELEAQHTPAHVAFGTLRGRGLYDQDLLDLLAGVVGVGAAARVREVAVGELEVGMTLAQDARSVRGELLVARGQHVTARLVERLLNLGSGHVHEPLRVFTTDGA